MLKRGLLTSFLLFVEVCMLAGLLLAAGLFLEPNPLSYLFLTPSLTPTPGLVIETAHPVPTAFPSADIPSDLAGQMDLIQNQVASIRGLPILESTHRNILTPYQFSQKVADKYQDRDTRQQILNDELLYTALGLIKPGTDLLSIHKNIDLERVSAYTDLENLDLYIVQKNGFGGPERMSFAHEFTHILQQEHYDLAGKIQLNGNFCLTHKDNCSAISALVEGDAASIAQDWLYLYGTSLDRSQVQMNGLNKSTPAFASSPDFIKDDLLFPYQKGYEFVQTLRDRSGLDGINQAFNQIPLSTEQIMHPNLYPQDQPMDVLLPDMGPVLGENWRLVSQGTLGEWLTYEILAKGWQSRLRLPEVDAQQAAAGWGGDSYAFYQNNSDPNSNILLVEWQWDTHADADQFWNALVKINKARWGDPIQESGIETKWSTSNGQMISVQYTNNGTRWVIASDQNSFDLVRSTVN